MSQATSAPQISSRRQWTLSLVGAMTQQNPGGFGDANNRKERDLPLREILTKRETIASAWAESTRPFPEQAMRASVQAKLILQRCHKAPMEASKEFILRSVTSARTDLSFFNETGR